MYIEFYGAAKQVTGSLHRVHSGSSNLVLDCGLFQGHRSEANRLNRELPDWAVAANAVVLSHAHVDHSGNIPTLVKRGFEGNVFCTPATRDLCSVMLRDSAMIQEQDAKYLNKVAAREGRDERITPLYEIADAMNAVQRMISVPYRVPLPITPDARLRFHNSGHVLGSALVELELRERGRQLKLLFSGDLGRPELPLLRDPEIVEGVEVLVLESTYGDRLHPKLEEAQTTAAEIIRKTIDRGGRVYIPAFALERAQEVLYSLTQLLESGQIPKVPIYIDSPLAIAITEVYKLHPESLAEELQALYRQRRSPLSPPGSSSISGIEESKALQRSDEPCIVIAGSGMCEAGRIVHHFTKGLSNPKNSVILVGFMAAHTLGRRLQEGRRRVKVLGVERDVRAEVFMLEGLSAHADQATLRHFAKETARRGNLRRIFLVHGEPDSLEELQRVLHEDGLPEPVIAEPGMRVEL